MRIRLVICSLIALAAVAPSLGETPLGTAFTYQGQLKEGGAPFEGTADFQFTLWDAVGSGNPPTGGIQVGGVQAINALPVASGLFTVALNAAGEFGVNAFNGNARWVQVAVRSPAGGGLFTTLTPRQALTPVPYAIQTRGIYVDPTGKVGIGTLVPSHALTIGSADQATLRLIGPTSGFGWGARLNFGDADYAFIEEDEDDKLSLSAKRFTFNGGHVGIGTTAPASPLEIAFDSTVETPHLTLRETALDYARLVLRTGYLPHYWALAATSFGEPSVDRINFYYSGLGDIMTITGQGRVGLGTVSPENKLDVSAQDETAISALGNGSFREQATLRVQNTQPNAGMAAYIKSQGTWAAMHLENSSTGEVLWLQNDGEGDFIVAHDASLGQRQFWVDKNGKTNVRVLQIHGGADLSEKFDVNVSHEATNEGSEPGADATGYSAMEGRGDEGIKVQPGMVVAIDPDDPGRLRVSSTPYDRTVAGIISGAGGVNSGMVMGQTGTSADGEHPVALSGRVYCFCEASNGPIRPGDLLTTSSVPGHAMKVADHPLAQGAIIGKAMSALSEGRGLVLVLVSLQ